MIKILIDVDGARSGWQLVNATASGADVLARSADDGGDGLRALSALTADDVTVHVVAAPDGHWKWVLAGPGGGIRAESPAVFPDAARCREAFADAQRAARDLFGDPARRRGGRPATAD